jgi:predicted patatin/cPLA2 family phospholipase
VTTLGLVLTGGGARAAYQVGALQALSEIADFDTTPFRVLTGVSAGAINATHTPRTSARRREPCGICGTAWARRRCFAATRAT